MNREILHGTGNKWITEYWPFLPFSVKDSRHANSTDTRRDDIVRPRISRIVAAVPEFRDTVAWR